MALKINAMFVGMTAVILGGHGAWLWVQQRKDIVGEHGGKEFPLITVSKISATYVCSRACIKCHRNPFYRDSFLPIDLFQIARIATTGDAKPKDQN